MILWVHCTCGDSMKIETNMPAGDRIFAIWKSVHTGAGHVDCDAETARLARDRNEQTSKKGGEG